MPQRLRKLLREHPANPLSCQELSLQNRKGLVSDKLRKIVQPPLPHRPLRAECPVYQNEWPLADITFVLKIGTP